MWHYHLHLSFVYKTRFSKPVSQISFNLFFSGDKSFYQGSLGNEVDFMNIMNVFPNILAKNKNFKKMIDGFADERAEVSTWKKKNHEKSQPGDLGGKGCAVFDFRLSERLNVTIWMLDEESHNTNHTRFRQTFAINAIFISHTLKLFRKILRNRGTYGQPR